MDADADPEDLSSGPGDIRLLANRQPDLEAEPEDGLVTYMALQDVDFDQAQRACEELYRRHAHRMVGWCLKNRAETYGQDATDLVDEAFLRAFRSAHSYRSRAGLDADGRRRHVMAWLFRILRNAYLDCRKGEQREQLVRDDSEDAGQLLNEAPDQEGIPDAGRVSPERRNLVLRFLDELDGVDKAILIATAESWSPTAAQTVLPRHICRSLCEEFGLTENSLRVRRFRVLEKLRLFISEEETKTSTHHEYPPKR